MSVALTTGMLGFVLPLALAVVPLIAATIVILIGIASLLARTLESTSVLRARAARTTFAPAHAPAAGIFAPVAVAGPARAAAVGSVAVVAVSGIAPVAVAAPTRAPSASDAALDSVIRRLDELPRPSPPRTRRPSTRFPNEPTSIARSFSPNQQPTASLTREGAVCAVPQPAIALGTSRPSRNRLAKGSVAPRARSIRADRLSDVDDNEPTVVFEPIVELSELDLLALGD